MDFIDSLSVLFSWSRFFDEYKVCIFLSPDSSSHRWTALVQGRDLGDYETYHDALRGVFAYFVREYL